jgi:uncharacterized protein (TIGR02001 family)
VIREKRIRLPLYPTVSDCKRAIRVARRFACTVFRTGLAAIPLMTAPTARDEIRHGDDACAAPTPCAWLAMTAALAIALAGTTPPAVAAEQADDSTSAAQPMVTKAPAAKTQADDAASFDAKFNAAVTSDYNYRGYTLSDHLPSVSANLEATYLVFFASVNTASVQIPGLSHFQMTDTIGLRPVIKSLTVEAGVGYYTYPGSATDESYPELYVAPSYTKDKLTLGVSLYYASNYYRTGAWENYNSVSAKYDLGSGFLVSAELGRQGFGTTNPTQASPGVKLPDYVYGNLGVSYTYKSLVFDLHFHATTLSKQSCFLITGTGSASAGSNGCEPAVIGTLTWNAGLSDLKTALGEKK